MGGRADRRRRRTRRARVALSRPGRGVLIDRLGLGGLLSANVLFSFPIILALVAIRTPLNDRTETAVRPPFVESLREGIAYVKDDPVFRPMFVLLMLVALLGRPYQQL